MSKSRSGAPRRVAAGLLAGALAVFGVALAPPAGAVEDVATDRLAGATRYGTAAAIAGQPDFDAASTAILASGENFPDALAASGLAGESAPAPIVLTQSATLTDETRVALSELGALDDVIVVGGTAAVSDEVVTAVEDEGYTVTRVAGNDRYETAAAIAGDITAGEIDGLTTALIASGEVFPDALAAGSVAYAANLPILLVNSSGIPAATEAALDGIEQVIILGGTARISDETETELEGIVGNDAVRVAGQDRNETATLIATNLAEGELGWAPEEVHLASGLNFPDALAAGPIGGERSAPLVLSGSIPPATLAYLDLNSDTIRRLNAIGGTAAVSDEDLQTAETEGAENTTEDASTGGDTQTSALQGPELQSAAISGIDAEELAISYTFTFDSELDEDDENPELFKLYNANTNDAALGDVFASGDEMEIDGESATVVFNIADSGVASATLAAVAEGAVTDENGNVNPAQSVDTGGLANASSNTVVGAEIVDEDDGIIEVEFGAPQPPGAPAANIYQLVMKEGYSFSGTPSDTLEGLIGLAGGGEATVENRPDDDEPSATVRVQFICTGDNTPTQYNNANTDANGETDDDPCSGKDAGDGADLTDENVRRLVVNTGGRLNTADISSGGTTDGPDLVNVEMAGENDALDDNQALFVFDEDISSIGTAPANAAAYALIYTHCAPDGTGSVGATLDAIDADDADAEYEDMDGQGFDDTIDLAGDCSLSPQTVNLGSVVDDDDFTEREVLLTFGSDLDDIDNDFLVAGQVGADAAVADDDTPTELNNNDEVEISGQPASVFDDGEVGGPQLVDAEVEVDTTFGGEFSAWVLTLTFDKDIDDAGAIAAGIQFFYDDGENVESDTLSCETDDDRTVTCEVTDDDSDFADAAVVALDAGVVVTDETFTLGDNDEGVQFANPEASIAVEVPEAPESDD